MKKIYVNCEIAEYMERLHFEANMANRELIIANKLSCPKEVVCKACRKARITKIKFETAKQIFDDMLRSKFPEMIKWSFEYNSREVSYEEV